jgi:hypothetical protein
MRSLDEFDDKTIDEHLDVALARLAKQDAVLFKFNANERSLSFRLALYLAQLFPDLDVDCEYNRHHRDERHRKRLFSRELRAVASRNVSLMDENGLTVFPDIIVHRRETDDNLLVIEIKKSTSLVKATFDLAKLAAYRSERGYSFAKFIRLGTGGERNRIVENRFVQ